MELRHLRYFVAAAQQEHFGRAAARLAIVQPALSRQIGELEEELGVALFERRARGVRLTAAGRAFLAEAEALLAQAGRAADRARDVGAGREGRLRIGFVDTAAYGPVLSRIFNSFRRHHPDVRLELAADPSLRQGELLREGALDLAFVYHLPPQVSTLATQQVREDRVVLAVPRAHALARRRHVRLAEVRDEAFVWIPRTLSPAYHERVFAACREQGFEPRVVQEGLTDQAILSLVALGAGLSFCLDAAAHQRPAEVELVRVLDLDIRVALTAAWRTDNANPALERLLCGLPGR